jgi:hypothetical protein
MARVTIAEKKIWVDGEAVPLLCGEVHYWRLAPEYWRAVLMQARAIGLQVIASYVPWEFHQTSAGVFDFQGETDPRRNLSGFLDLLAEMGFWVFIRPGPYIYAEWNNAGIPAEAVPYHRLDARYLPLARKYLEAVIPVLKPHFATQDGRIILCQVENEVDCWPHMYTEDLGLGSRPGFFQQFLQETYGSIDALNAAWGARYPDFQQARAILSLPPGRQDLMPRYLDYYRFKHWYVLQVARWCVDTFRALGVDVPIVMNTIASHSNEPWAAMEEVVDLVGTDLYPSNGFSHPHEHRKFMEAARYLSTYSKLPFISEFESGIWHGDHVQGALLPHHYRMAAVSALAAGAAGWDWYMLHNRDNWYMSPINERGLPRTELFPVFQQIVNLFRCIDPTTLEKLTPVTATIDPLQQAAAHPESEVLQALSDADVDYAFFDVVRGKNQAPVMFYAGGAWLSREGQERLLQYVESGGHLICLGEAPHLDERQSPLNLLGFAEPDGVIGDMGAIHLALTVDESSFRVKTNRVEIYAHLEVEQIFAERGSVDELAMEELRLHCSLPQGQIYPVGYTRLMGQGRLTYLGLQPSKDLILGLLDAYQVEIPVHALTPGFASSLFQQKGTYYLMLVNLGSEERCAELALSPRLLQGKSPRFKDLLRPSQAWVASRAQGHIYCSPIPGKDAAVYEITRA